MCEELFHDIHFGGIADQFLRRAEKDIICGGQAALKLKLFQDAARCGREFPKFGHHDDEVDAVLLMILSDVFNLIFDCQLFEECLVVARPLTDGQLSDLQLCI